MSRNRHRATRALYLLVCPDIMFVAACLDQCPVDLVPFRKLWTLTLKLRMDNDTVCLVWYIIYIIQC